MEQHPERAAKIINRQGDTVSQGVFSGEVFDHLVEKRAEPEEHHPEERPLIIGAIYLTFHEIYMAQKFRKALTSSTPYEMFASPEEKTLQEFIILMSNAFARACYNSGKEKMELAGEVSMKHDEDYSSVSIYSNPEIKGIQVEIHDPKQTARVDLTKDNCVIKIRKTQEREFRKISAVEFLGYDSTAINNAETRKVLSTGMELDQKIFRTTKPNTIENGR